MNGGTFASAMPNPLIIPIAAQKASVAGTAQGKEAFCPLVSTEIIIALRPATTPIDRSIPPSRMVSPWPKDAITRKIEVTSTALSCCVKLEPGLSILVAMISSAAQASTTATGSSSGLAQAACTRSLAGLDSLKVGASRFAIQPPFADAAAALKDYRRRGRPT